MKRKRLKNRRGRGRRTSGWFLNVISTAFLKYSLYNFIIHHHSSPKPCFWNWKSIQVNKILQILVAFLQIGVQIRNFIPFSFQKNKQNCLCWLLPTNEIGFGSVMDGSHINRFWFSYGRFHASPLGLFFNHIFATWFSKYKPVAKTFNIRLI